MIELPAWLTITPAEGYPVWRLIEVQPVLAGTEHPCDNGSTNCYFKTLDEAGKIACTQNLIWATPDEAATLDMPGDVGYCYDEKGVEVPYCLAVAMSGDSSFSPDRGEVGPYSAKIAGNSDKISGMGLRLKRHDQYTFVFQLQNSGGELPIPPGQPDEPEPGEWFIKRQTDNRIVLVRK